MFVNMPTPRPPDKKVITTETIASVVRTPAVYFQESRYEVAIKQHGYNIFHQKALRCSCINKETGTPLPNCLNCGGIGYFHIEKTRTKALVQGMNNQKKQQNWSETNAGLANITTSYSENISYMDRISIIDLELNFSQVVYPTKSGDKLFAFLIYTPIKMLYVYMFIGALQAQKVLRDKQDYPSDWDFYVEDNKIFLNNSKYTEDDEELSLSVRYLTMPEYFIIDIKRELFKGKDAGENVQNSCEGQESVSLVGMPQLSVGRRAHYMWDAKDLDGNRLHDNTDYTKINSKLIEP